MNLSHPREKSGFIDFNSKFFITVEKSTSYFYKMNKGNIACSRV